MPRRTLLAALAPIALPAQTNPRLRILTYNIHHGEGTDGKLDLARLARIINGLNPDVVALQEVDRRTNRSAQVDQAARLAELTGMHSAFGTALYYDGGEYGEAVLSRFPIAAPKARRLPFHPGQEPRTALEATIRPDNGLPEFLLVGTHWCHQSSDTRTEQAEQTNRLYPAQGGPPVILAGDLNARPGSPPINTLIERQWVDAVAPESKIDYVLYRQSDPWRVLEVAIPEEDVASDHRPVLAVLEWRGA